jgi:ankyrin repeat protein
MNESRLQNLLHEAIRAGSFPLLKKALKLGADPNHKGGSAYFKACSNLKTEMAKFLLPITDMIIPFDDCFFSTHENILITLKHGDDELIRMLLDKVGAKEINSALEDFHW